MVDLHSPTSPPGELSVRGQNVLEESFGGLTDSEGAKYMQSSKVNDDSHLETGPAAV